MIGIPLILFGQSLVLSQEPNPPSPVASVGKQQLQGHLTKSVLQMIGTYQLVGNVPLDENFYLGVGFPQQNKEALNEEAKSLYDPQSPNYHKFLKPEEFGDRYGLPEADYQKSIQFFQDHGFRIQSVFKNRLYLSIYGKVDDIQKTFHVRLINYKMADGRLFHAPDREPSLDLDVPVTYVSGLVSQLMSPEGEGRGFHIKATISPGRPWFTPTPEPARGSDKSGCIDIAALSGLKNFPMEDRQGYNVYLSVDNGRNYRKVNLKPIGAVSSFVIDGLKPGNRYLFNFRVEDKYGELSARSKDISCVATSCAPNH